MVFEYLRIYQDLFSRNQSPTLVNQVLLFLLCSVYIERSSSFLDTVEENYAASREDLSNPRRGNLHKQILEENTIDSYYYGEFSNRVSDLVETTRSLADVIKSRLSGSHDSASFLCFAAEVEGHCSGVKNSMARLNSSLESRLKIFELSKNAQEQARNWLLSILASIFLPLSLATSILSMQTRFADLHLLLYDFCGVIVLLATLVLVLLLVVSAILYCREKLAKYETNLPRHGTLLKRIVLIIFFWVLCTAWMVTIASFLCGMIVDVKLGLKILGFGAAGVFGIVLLLVFGVVYLSIGS
jgi:hypothetical protein